ncbi:MAG: dicarboxylate/amino acid:cation symporter, partial [Anaerotignaceae bacterium]
MEKTRKIGFSFWILIAIILGILAGLMLSGAPEIATTYLQPFGTIFLNLIKFIVVPIVFFTIIAGVISMNDIKAAGSIGMKALVFYFTTTTIAVILALVIVNLFKGSFTVLETTDITYEAPASVSLMQTFVNIFPSNIITPSSNATMLQVIIAALLFGAGILHAGEKGKTFAGFVNSTSEVCISIMGIIIKLSPIAVFCLITPVVATYGANVLGSLGMVVLCAYTGYAIHTVLVYSVAVKFFGRLSPITFFKEMYGAMLFAFSSASSVGTMPINIETCKRMGVKSEILNLVLPLGATINMDGTAIYQGVCSVFIAVCFGIDLTLAQMAIIVTTAVLASIGTAGVPGSGVI